MTQDRKRESQGPEGITLLTRLDSEHRLVSRVCPGCEADVSIEGVVDLAYTFRTCECGTPDYAHIVEQLWHLACLQGRRPDVEKAAASVVYHLEKWPTGPARAGAKQVVDRLRDVLDSRRQGGVVQQVGSSDAQDVEASREQASTW